MPIDQASTTIESVKQAPRQSTRDGASLGTRHQTGAKVWIDLENSPHIPFFEPIIEELKKRNFQVVLTARDCFQVCELADMAGFDYRKIGRHYGKNRIAKLVGLGIRVLQMAPFIFGERPSISVSHGSRTSTVLSALLGIRSISIADYEFADFRLSTLLGSARKKWVMTPEVIPASVFEKKGMLRDHVLQYPGIKEDVYVPFFMPDPSLKKELAIEPTDLLVTIRPPATEAHYHNPESEKILAAVLERLEADPQVKTILLPRTPRQEAELRAAYPQMFASGRMIVPKHVVNGLDLIWYSDVVISGGGTMNREAAALGVPVYSLFRGAMGAVDKHLSDTGKLIFLESVQEVREKLRLVQRSRASFRTSGRRETLDAVVNHISTILTRRG